MSSDAQPVPPAAAAGSAPGRPTPSSTAARAAARSVDEPWTTRRLLAWMQERFEASGVEPPRLVGEMLLAHVLDCERMRLYMEPDRPASRDELDRLRSLVVRVAAHEPVQYAVGEATFYGRSFFVDPSTLIPQPCTEELVAEVVRFLRPERASVFDRFDLQRLDALLEGDPEAEERAEERAGEQAGEQAGAADVSDASPDRATDSVANDATATDSASTDSESADAPPEGSPLARGPRVADVGTGSGCIAVSIARAVPGCSVLGTDIADEALTLATRNAERHGVADRVVWRRGDLLEPVRAAAAEHGPFDAIVSNPPYIPDAEWDGGQVERQVREHVPERALRGGPDGLQFIKPILREAPQLLRPGGLLAVECAASHAAQVLEWATIHPRLEGARLVHDEDGHPRHVIARRPDPAARAADAAAADDAAQDS